ASRQACRAGTKRVRARSGTHRPSVSSLVGVPLSVTDEERPTLRRTCRRMVVRALPFVLALAVVGADSEGRHSLALALLLVAIPAAGAAALTAFGDALDGICRGPRPLLAALALVLLVVSAALRTPAAVGR